MTSTLASAAETAQGALNSVLPSAINTDVAADPLDPVTGASSREKIKSPTEEKLEGFFGNRPDKKELQDKGILKGESESWESGREGGDGEIRRSSKVEYVLERDVGSQRGTSLYDLDFRAGADT